MNPNLVYRRIEDLERTVKTLTRRLEMLEGRVDVVDGTQASRVQVEQAVAKAKARLGV